MNRNSNLESLLTSCLGRLVLGFGVAFILFGGMGAIALVGAYLPIPEELRALVISICSLGMMVLVLGGLIWFAFSLAKRRDAAMDEAFRGFGLEGARYLMMGRQYRGTYRGREINVYSYTSGGRYSRVPVLQLYVAGDIPTRVGIGTRNILSTIASNMLNRDEMPIDDPAYVDIKVYPEEEAWARGLFADAGTREDIAALLGPETPATRRALLIGPGSVNLTLRYYNQSTIEPETLRRILTRMLRIADAAEDQPRPAVIIEETGLQQRSRSDRRSFRWIAWAVIGVVLVCPLLAGGLVFLILTLGNF